MATPSGNKSRKRKSLSWQTDDKLLQIHHFELIADERVNVYKAQSMGEGSVASTLDVEHGYPSTSASPVYPGNSAITNKELGSPKIISPNSANNNINNNIISSCSSGGSNTYNNNINNNNGVSPHKRARLEIEPQSIVDIQWRPLISIDYDPELPPPGWNSNERIAQAERESCVLGAIDLPGQPSTLDEPDPEPMSITSTVATSSNNNPLNNNNPIRHLTIPLNGNNSNAFSSTNQTTGDLNQQQQHNPDQQQSHQQQTTTNNINIINNDDLIIPLESVHGVYTEYYDMYVTRIHQDYANYSEFKTMMTQSSCQGLC